MFYVMLALRSRLREMAWFRDNNQVEPNMAELLDLVALGTIADVVPLDHKIAFWLLRDCVEYAGVGRGRV